MAVSEREIRDNYHTPGHPTAFAGVSKTASFYDGAVSEGVVRKALEASDAYTLHREYKQPRYYNPYYVYKQREQVQADLIDVRELARYNDGVTYLLLLIDLFSRRVWTLPMRSKTAVSTRDALQSWLTSLGSRKCEVFATDSGLEFKNILVRRLLRAHGVEQQFKSGTSKASYAERANKSMQVLIYKYLTHKQTLRYIDVLSELTDTYNNRAHRSLDGTTPHEADKPRSQMWIRGVLKRAHTDRALKARRSPKLKVGDSVRVKILAKKISKDSRAYQPQFKGEYFTVTGVSTNMMVPMYQIRSQDTGETISDSFYAEELQIIRGAVFKVERVLEERGDGPNRELLIKWLFFGPRHNSWEPAANVTEVYRRDEGGDHPRLQR